MSSLPSAQSCPAEHNGSASDVTTEYDSKQFVDIQPLFSSSPSSCTVGPRSLW
jgi:hypothetical protein